MRFLIRLRHALLFFAVAYYSPEVFASLIVDSADCRVQFFFNSGYELGADEVGGDRIDSKIAEIINNAKETLDIAIHDLDHPALIQAILSAAERGVRVRLLTDSKDRLEEAVDSLEGNSRERSVNRRLVLEKLRRGNDGLVGTADDVWIFADSPIEAVENAPNLRRRSGLPLSPGGDGGLDLVRIKLGKIYERSSYLLSGGFLRTDGDARGLRAYWSPATRLLHHKFLVADSEIVQTGSYNYTISGLYGSHFDWAVGDGVGHHQHILIFENREVAEGFQREFDRLWGGATSQPNESIVRERAGGTAFESDACGFRIRGYFTPRDNVEEVLSQYIGNAERNVRFAFFVFTQRDLIGALLRKWRKDSIGIRGIIDNDFYERFRDVVLGIDRNAGKLFESSVIGNRAPIQESALFRKMHAKTMVIDGGVGDDGVVITGSANWTGAVFDNKQNFENILIIHSPQLAKEMSLVIDKLVRSNPEQRGDYCPVPVWRIEKQVDAEDLVENVHDLLIDLPVD